MNTTGSTGWWTAGALRRAIGAEWHTPGGPDADPGAQIDTDALDAIPIRGAAIDSREVEPGNAFFALRGERTDGHRYLAKAAEAGAGVAVIAGPAFVTDLADAGVDLHGLPMLIAPPIPSGTEDVDRETPAPDPVAIALARAGTAYRTNVLDATVIGVTGSNGKTTVVRMIASILDAAGVHVGASRRSFNTRVGVPVTLLNTDPACDAVVCEAGTSLPGEIGAIGAIMRPDVGVITSIGHAHLEGLGSTHGVAVEKSALVDAIEPGGVAVLNVATRHPEVLLDAVPAHAARILVAPLGHTAMSADLCFAVRAEDEHGLEVDIGAEGDAPERVRVLMAGGHNGANAALAAGVALSLGPERLRGRALGFDAIRDGLARAEAPPMRLERREIGGVLVVNDAYNANPDSMLAALMSFDRIAGDRRRVLVLGDMLELGEAEAPAHEELGIVARRARPGVAVWVGPASQHAARAMLEAPRDDRDPEGPAPEVHWQPELDLDAVGAMIRPGDAVLLKGSRAVGLERVEEAIAASHVSGDAPATA